MLMKKLYIAVLAMAVVLPAAAQDTYESGRLLMNDLNGTARYVGMGGAMEALGAEISTISTNPAGIGLFRHSTVSVSAGLVSQQDVKEFAGKNGTKMSFDQLGIVYSSRVSRSSFVNVGFNFHKSHNFNQILSAANDLRNASLNMLSYHKADLENVRKGGYYWDFNDRGHVIGYESETSPYRAQTFSQVDYLNMNALNLEFDVEDKAQMFYNAADYYMFDRSQRGWISDFDFNVSGNQGDRFYWGVTVGIHDVNYKGYSIYTERLVNGSGSSFGSDDNEDYVDYIDTRRIEGTGIDVKAGIIVRPIEDSPFRFGLYVSSPTWYELTTDNDTDFNNDSEYGAEDSWYSGESYKFRYYTPWKFGVSLGHTFGSSVAAGFTYEFSDYSTAVNRIITDDSNYYYDSERSYADEVMKVNTKNSLKSVHLFKAGVEYKPDTDLALRAGYNYQSSAYNKDGVRDMMLDSPGVSYASTSDYVNWKDTHRITFGFGYKLSGWNFDVAYQYQLNSGDFYPMQKFENDQNVGATKVDYNRHQVLFTVGYTF
jgi:hypothetical protein